MALFWLSVPFISERWTQAGAVQHLSALGQREGVINYPPSAKLMPVLRWRTNAPSPA